MVNAWSTPPPTPPVHVNPGPGSFEGTGTKQGHTGTPGGPGGTSALPIKVIDCGPARVQGSVQGLTASPCATVINDCAVVNPAGLSTDPHVTTTATLQQQPDGSWQLVGVNCAAVSVQPQVTVAMVEEEFRKRVPSPAIGVAPQGDTLVNIETVLWVNTAPDQALATVTLVGHRVDLHIRLAQVDWTFGDGTSDLTTSPERPYSTAHPCTTPDCAHYWGHTYTSIGAMRITATVYWTGKYRVDGGAWLTIPTRVAGPASATTITVHEARGVLVDAPR
jgi:hypothetical protein